MLENKWKRFAIYQTLSDWADIAPEDLFDRLMLEDAEGLKALIDELEVSIWQPFEDWHISNVVSHMEELARCAQETANDNERADIDV